MSFLLTVRAVLQEIFDESAYRRFCLREGVPQDRNSYAKFLREKAETLKPRCC